MNRYVQPLPLAAHGDDPAGGTICINSGDLHSRKIVMKMTKLTKMMMKMTREMAKMTKMSMTMTNNNGDEDEES